MASAITHAVAAASISCCFYRQAAPRSVWITGIICAVLPDADVLGFYFGVPYDGVFGHRGITHSLAFAAALAALVVGVRYRAGVPGLSARKLWCYLFLVTASHGTLDAFTNGGRGVAFFAPIWNERFFFPVTPIEVSPLSVTGFLNARGLRILANEAVWVWLPAALLAGIGLAARCFRPSPPPA